MQRDANNRLLFTESSSIERICEVPMRIGQSGFYQEIALKLTQRRYRKEEVVGLAQRLVALASNLYSFRQMDRLETVSEHLSNLPLPPEYTLVGKYYKALCLKRSGSSGQARLEFERLAMKGSLVHRARATMAAGAIALDGGNFATALRLLIDARKAAASNGWCDPLTTVGAERNICAIRSLDGDHKGALDSLERMLPLVQTLGSSNPFLLFDHLNSLAVEMMEVGRLDEAARASHIALSSPYASAYPEWHETRNDIVTRSRRPSRAAVALSRPLSQSTELEAPCSVPAGTVKASVQPRVQESASILLFPRRHEPLSPPPPKPAKITAQELAQMSVSQKRALVLAQAQCCETSEAVFDRLLQAAGLVVEEDRQNEIDLESPGSLEEMITHWVNGGVEPEQFAAVMSALRDCDDQLRITNILDRMISYAFRETSQNIDCEDRWRRKVEAQLEPRTPTKLN
jgi:hypothetical protein